MPLPFSAAAKLNLVYELHLTNLDRKAGSMTLTSLEILDAATASSLTGL